MLLVEGLLDGVKVAVVREPLDRRDVGAVRLDGEHGAGLHRHPVEMHGAGAALGGVAGDLRPGQAEAVADEVDEERPRLDFGLAGNAVDSDRDVQDSTPWSVAGG
jgi:hypothetical protein